MTMDEIQRRIRVGIFITIALVVLIASVFILGKSKSVFADKITFYCWFENIGGLVKGAPVRLGGVDIGIVQEIRFTDDLKERRVRVTLGVQKAYLDRIRQDSVARLSSKGLLGDQLIDIEVGSPQSPPHKDGDTIISQESEGLSKVIATVQLAINDVRNLTNEVNKRLQMVLTQTLATDIERIAHSTANVIEEVEKGKGFVHQLIYDQKYDRQISAMLEESRAVVANVNSAVIRVDQIVAEIQKGKGTVHRLVYEDDTSKIFQEIQRASREIADVVTEVRTGNGLLHSFIYSEDRTNLIQNLTEISKIMRTLAEETQQGKGTVGALLKDPTVYEDLKTLLGNVKRNKLLKGLIRYTIEKDDLKRTGKIGAPAFSQQSIPGTPALAQPPVTPAPSAPAATQSP
ncbi:MAG: hypothetical protein GMKNLPBB_00896 [Myxococcota bacterium]|nr:hypothetical protein [Myxococcota bacterium]